MLRRRSAIRSTDLSNVDGSVLARRANGDKPKPALCKSANVAAWGSWDQIVVIAVAAQSYQTINELNGLESPVIEGDNPVPKNL
jgi:hypothetical protein